MRGANGAGTLATAAAALLPNGAPAVGGIATGADALQGGTSASLSGAAGLSPISIVTIQDQCVTVTYHHKPSAAHPDEESCSHHKNMLRIPELGDKRIAAGSVCVRVNGTAVHYLTGEKATLTS